MPLPLTCPRTTVLPVLSKSPGRCRPDVRKENAMRKMTRGAAAVLLGSALAATAAAQTPPGLPAPTGVAPTQPVSIPAPAIRPTGAAATVNGQAIPEVAVYRAIRQFPPAHHEAA